MTQRRVPLTAALALLVIAPLGAAAIRTAEK
jgi:hypothetical protein